MFLRMIFRAAVLRRGRALSALLAVCVAAAVATTLLMLQFDTRAKLQREFRNYGANIVVSGKPGTPLPSDSAARVDSAVAGRGIWAPFAFVIAHTPSGQAVVVAGTDFVRAKELDRFWSVSAWPAPTTCTQSPCELPALFGIRAKQALAEHNQNLALTFHDRTVHVAEKGTVQAGGPEDSRIYISLADFAAWSGGSLSTIEIAAGGSNSEINTTLNSLTQAFPDAEVNPVRRILEGQARVLDRTRSTMLAAAVLVAITAALCVLSTLMGWLFDRRRDFAIMKAIGASDRLLNSFFMAESAALGVAGALPGFLIGLAGAAWISHANFHSSLTPRMSVLPIVLGGSVAVTLLAALLPVSRLHRLQPAAILRGE
jgi:putative ABC transport system permease protein